MKLARAIGLRVLYGLVSLLFISFITFIADEFAPGDAALLIVGEKGSPEAYERQRHAMGLDRPWPVRYVEFIGNAARGDFGHSYIGTKEPVSEILARNLPMTAKIATLAILLASAVGITLGTLAALKENRWPDRAVLTMSTLGVTVPNFVLAPVLVLIFAYQLEVLPTSWEPNLRAPELYYLILPVFILSLRPMASLTRLTRASMIETLNQEFVRLAVAKGIPRRRMIFRHALRNAILPVVTAIGTNFGFLLTGSFIIETAFILPGVGHAAIEAIQKRDTPVIQATTLVAGLLFIGINLIVDILLPILDPRIREAQI